MTNIWTLDGVGFDTLYISQPKRSTLNQGPDTLSFQVTGYVDDAPLAEHGAVVTVRRDGTPYFIGRVNSIERSGASTDEGISYRLDGPWWWLEKITYEQLWKLWNITASAVESQYTSRCIINQGPDGKKIKSGEQIREALQLAIDRGAPIAIGTIDAGIDLPSTEETDIKIAELIIRQLRWSPDLVAWFDYSQVPPVFNVTKRADMPVFTWNMPGEISGVRFQARRDLQSPGVVLRYEETYEQTNEIPGADGEMYPISQKFETLREETAGDANNIERHLATFKLGGTSAHYVSQRIKTEALPVPAKITAAWWSSRDTEVSGTPVTLQGYTIQWTLVQTVYNDVDVEGKGYNRILLDGTIQPWMLKRGIGSADLKIIGTFQIDVTDSDAKLTTIYQTRTLNVTVTNAATKVYHNLENTDTDVEPVPVNLAADLYAAWSQLQYEGSVELTQEECTAGIGIGYKLNITGGPAEWETMGAIVQQVDEDLETGKTTVTCGPAAHLGADDLITLFREQRKRTVSTAWVSRTSAVCDDNRISQQAPTVTPKSGVTASVQVPVSGGGSEWDGETVELQVVTGVVATSSAVNVQFGKLTVPKGSTVQANTSSSQVVALGGWTV